MGNQRMYGGQFNNQLRLYSQFNGPFNNYENNSQPQPGYNRGKKIQRVPSRLLSFWLKKKEQQSLRLSASKEFSQIQRQFQVGELELVLRKPSNKIDQIVSLNYYNTTKHTLRKQVGLLTQQRKVKLTTYSLSIREPIKSIQNFPSCTFVYQRREE
ncbi:unnamed protein product [Paramecium octaurelia]|uniref:Uncharacterized protein n=1 Tax=Paramecium octaurelia TaxID=43137 RepID=A0A8S1XYA6_PAROT|nr:unnamed protein product [Paramecium octaurelia]